MLIFLGGCFLIGVDDAGYSRGLLYAGPSSAKDMWMTVLLLVLALGCFAGATCLIVLGVKALLQIIRS